MRVCELISVVGTFRDRAVIIVTARNVILLCTLCRDSCSYLCSCFSEGHLCALVVLGVWIVATHAGCPERRSCYTCARFSQFVQKSVCNHIEHVKDVRRWECKRIRHSLQVDTDHCQIRISDRKICLIFSEYGCAWCSNGQSVGAGWCHSRWETTASRPAPGVKV